MKKIYTILPLILFALNTMSQPWAQTGAHWYYENGDNLPTGGSGYLEVTKVGDSIILGKLCDILTLHFVGITFWNGGQPYDYYSPNQYTYLSNDTVYNWLI